VDLQEIDVCGIEAGDGRVDSVEDCSARQTTLVNVLGQLFKIGLKVRLNGRIIDDETIALGGDYDLGAWNVVLWSSYTTINECQFRTP
jgi:hypothetical protein